MRKNIFFTAVVIMVVMSLYLLSTKEIVWVPADRRHANMLDEKICLDCHAEGRENPLKKNHPPKFQCLECHKAKEAG